MTMTYGGAEVQGVTYNGAEVQSITYNGTEVWSAVKPLANCTWAEIKQIIQAGKASKYWKVGDTKEFDLDFTYDWNRFGSGTLSGTYRAMILGVDHNKDIETGGSHNVHFAIFKETGSEDVVITRGRQTSTDNHHGWDNRMNVWLNYESSEGLYANLPTDMKNVIGKMTKYSTEYVVNSAGNGNYRNSAFQDYIYIPDEYEVFGETTYADSGLANYQKKYTYFQNGGSKILYQGNARTEWWLRSKAKGTGNVGHTCMVDSNGEQNFTLEENPAGVVPIFAIF